eukprot:scaffold102_cov170-Ochromonas_danica.AAC.3
MSGWVNEWIFLLDIAAIVSVFLVVAVGGNDFGTHHSLGRHLSLSVGAVTFPTIVLTLTLFESVAFLGSVVGLHESSVSDDEDSGRQDNNLPMTIQTNTSNTEKEAKETPPSLDVTVDSSIDDSNLVDRTTPWPTDAVILNPSTVIRSHRDGLTSCETDDDGGGEDDDITVLDAPGCGRYELPGDTLLLSEDEEIGNDSLCPNSEVSSDISEGASILSLSFSFSLSQDVDEGRINEDRSFNIQRQKDTCTEDDVISIASNQNAIPDNSNEKDITEAFALQREKEDDKVLSEVAPVSEEVLS